MVKHDMVYWSLVTKITPTIKVIGLIHSYKLQMWSELFSLVDCTMPPKTLYHGNTAYRAKAGLEIAVRVNANMWVSQVEMKNADVYAVPAFHNHLTI